MRQTVIVLLVLSLVLVSLSVKAADDIEIEAAAAVLMDRETGRVLWAREPHTPLPPASTTKVMTLLLGLELGQPEEIVTVSHVAQSQEGSSVYLGAGEEYTLRELLYALQLSSANDAAVAVAEHLAGSVEEFAGLMNQRARELGARNTNFVNPNGLPDPDHRTSAYDLALVTREALHHPEFRQIITMSSYPMSWPGREEDRQLYNRNRFLQMYEGADGVKTGYTTEAGHTFIGSATREGRQLIAVVLGSSRDGVWSDTIALLDYGFENFTNREVVVAGTEITSVPVKYGDQVALLAGEDFIYTLALGEEQRISTEVQVGEDLIAPVGEGQALGTLTVYLGEEELAQLPLVAAVGVGRKIYTNWWFWPIALYIPWRVRVAIRRWRRYRRRRRP